MTMRYHFMKAICQSYM